MIDSSLSCKQINAMKAQPMYLRDMALNFEAEEMDATARDYRDSADMIENLLAMIGLLIFS